MTIKSNSVKSSPKQPSYTTVDSVPQEPIPPKTTKPYSVSIMFRCGCGYKTRILNEAVNHCMVKHHSIEVSGWVRYLHHIPESKVKAVEESQTKFDQLDSHNNDLHDSNSRHATFHGAFGDLKEKLASLQLK